MSRLEDIVLVERHINASPATVFSFFSNSERWLLWQGVEATIELRPGGLFRVNVSGDGFAAGRILEVIPNRRLVFTWGWEMSDHGVPPGSSTVRIELLPDGSGTLLRLTHTGLPPESVDLHQQGWDLYTGRLQAVASEGAE
ncbi:MAG TPA: SRPBCC family protein [Chloroflexota bacterium]